MNQQYKQAILNALAANKATVLREQVATFDERLEQLAKILKDFGCKNVFTEGKMISFSYKSHHCEFLCCDFGNDDQNPLIWELIIETDAFDTEEVDEDKIENMATKLIDKLTASGLLESGEDYEWDYDEEGDVGKLRLCINNGEHID